MIRSVLGPLALTVAMLGFATPIRAATLTWNTCVDGADTNTTCDATSASVTPSSVSNSGSGTSTTYTFQSKEDATKTVSVRAYRSGSVDGTGAPLKTQATLLGTGLGADSIDPPGGDESGAQRGLDNVGQDEFLVFRLPSDTSVPKSFTLGERAFGADVKVWIGGNSATDAVAILDAGCASQGGLGWNKGACLTAAGYSEQTLTGVQPGVAQSLFGTAAGRYLVIGPQSETDYYSMFGWFMGTEDLFTVMQVTADVSGGTVFTAPQRVPIPATLLLVTVTLSAGLVVRRLHPSS